MIVKEINYFTDSFLKFRKKNISKLIPYNELLFSEFVSKEKLNKKYIFKETSLGRHIKKVLSSIVSYIIGSFKTKSRISLLKTMLNKDSNVLFLVISSDKLMKKQVKLNLRTYLAKISKGFKDSENPNLLHDKILKKKNIILFDINNKSRIPYYKELFQKEGILLIDQDFIKSFALNYPFKCFKYISEYIYQRFKNKNASKTLIPVVLLYAEIFDLLFSSFSKVESYFFTSNTFSMEVLRYYFMLQKSSTSINEIMHGIPSEIVQTHFMRLININDKINSGAKMNFILQMPTIKDVVLNERSDCVSKDIFINSYINAYFLGIKEKHKNLYNYFEHEFNYIFSNNYNNEFLFLYVGGTLISPEYEKSISFRVELEMIQIIRNFFKSKNKAYKILYAPHPFNNLNNLLNQKVFQEKDIVFIKDTFKALLMAQAATGIVTSVLFEAKMFNIPSYMPMKPSDEMFTKEELNLLAHPKLNQDRKVSFKEFLNTIDLSKKTNIKTQLKHRINIINYE